MGLWLFTNVKEFLFLKNELLKHLFHLLFFHYFFMTVISVSVS